MTKEEIKQKLEELLFNQNIDNPYINIDVATEWIINNFAPKAKPKVDWIEQWTTLFPKDLQVNGQPIYNKPKDCLNKMQKFVKDYPEYEKGLIFAATKAYLQNREHFNWEYTRNASNFISHRDKGSLLASWCEKLLNELNNPIPKEKERLNKFFI